MGPYRSGVPLGLDPFGKSPNNPIDGKRLQGNQDYENVVNQRIDYLSSHVYSAKKRLKKVAPSKKKLAEELGKMTEELANKNQVITEISRLIEELNK